MKTLLFLSFAFIGLNVSSQNLANVQCNSMTVDSERDLIEYIGCVNLKTTSIEITDAESIVFNKLTKEFIATGFSTFKFAGDLIVSNNNKHKTLRYKIGDGTAYLD